MKVIAAFLATLSLASAFAPLSTKIRVNTELAALFDDIQGMDLWTPVKDQNNYGARAKKNLKSGKIGTKSYVPAGLTASQYASVRASDEKKKSANYQKNVSKAFKYLGFNAFYQKRGTDLDGAWKKSPTLGHRMAKTKFDFSGKKDEVKAYDGSKGSVFGGKSGSKSGGYKK